MVVVRLQRLGTKKAPHHRVVVTQQQRAQSSRVLEVVGYYDPSYEPVRLSLNKDRIQHWVKTGAQISEAVQALIHRVDKPAKKKPVKQSKKAKAAAAAKAAAPAPAAEQAKAE